MTKFRYCCSLPFYLIALAFYLLGTPFVIIARMIDTNNEFP